MTDYCGWPTADGSACEHPATDDKTGRCWQHTEDAKKGGRPSKFNDERAREVLEAARECKSIRGCGRAAGVVENTILNWLRENPEFESETGETREFLRAFMRARAEAETLLTRGPLSRPDEIDGQHARFLLKTSFGYQDSLELLLDDHEDGQSTEETVEELQAIFED
jgi:hypothetical protein